MRILFFIESLAAGGTQRRMIELITFLKNNTGFELSLVVTEEEIHFETIHSLNIPTEIIKRKMLKYDPSLFVKFYRYCCSFKPDVIHTWGIMTTFYAIPAKFFCRAKLISNLINDSNKYFKLFSLKNLFFHTDVLCSDLILANSRAGVKAYKINPSKVKIIYNGVNLERFLQHFDAEAVRRSLGVTTQFVGIMIASFSKYKDYDLLVEIAKKTASVRNDITFIGVGDGSEFERIQKRITRENVNNLILTGNQNNVERIIAASDIGLMCTYSEGISNSIIEYMAMGKPAISTDISGGSKELIIEGETGYCVERDVSKITKLISNLLDNKELRIRMGQLGKDRAFRHFSVNRFANEIQEVYNLVLNKRIEK